MLSKRMELLIDAAASNAAATDFADRVLDCLRASDVLALDADARNCLSAAYMHIREHLDATKAHFPHELCKPRQHHQLRGIRQTHKH